MHVFTWYCTLTCSARTFTSSVGVLSLYSFFGWMGEVKFTYNPPMKTMKTTVGTRPSSLISQGNIYNVYALVLWALMLWFTVISFPV